MIFIADCCCCYCRVYMWLLLCQVGSLSFTLTQMHFNEIWKERKARICWLVKLFYTISYQEFCFNFSCRRDNNHLNGMCLIVSMCNAVTKQCARAGKEKFNETMCVSSDDDGGAAVKLLLFINAPQAQACMTCYSICDGLVRVYALRPVTHDIQTHTRACDASHSPLNSIENERKFHKLLPIHLFRNNFTPFAINHTQPHSHSHRRQLRNWSNFVFICLVGARVLLLKTVNVSFLYFCQSIAFNSIHAPQTEMTGQATHSSAWCEDMLRDAV